jgi:5-methylcytosine-specific restriction endonuclease McrA
MATGKPLLKEKDKPRKISLKGLKTKAWEAVSRYVRQRDKGVCQTCGKVDDWRNQQAGHYRHNTERNQLLGGNRLWYDLRNLNCQCPQCNKWKNGNLNAYAIFLERKYGHGILEELDFLYRTPKKFSREELLILIKVMDEMTHALPL